MGRLFLFGGPSGAGKTTTAKHVCDNKIITTTSRQPREGEKHGVDYYFVTKDEFENLIKMNELIEYDNSYDGNNYYGLTKSEYQWRLSKEVAINVCNDEGVKFFKKLNPESVSIFIYTSLNDVEKQLRERGDEDTVIQKRLSLYERDLKNIDFYDHIILNEYNKLHQTIQKTRDIIAMYMK